MIHETAVIDELCDIDTDTRILSGTKIGIGCNMRQNMAIMLVMSIGKQCYFMG